MSWQSEHEQAVTHGEIRRLANALRPYRILSHEMLAREVHVGHWPAGDFDRALAAAVREGVIEELPLAHYRICDS